MVSFRGSRALIRYAGVCMKRKNLVAGMYTECHVRNAIRLSQARRGPGTDPPGSAGRARGCRHHDSGSGLQSCEREHPVVLGHPVCGGWSWQPWDADMTSESVGYTPRRGIAESEATTGRVTASQGVRVLTLGSSECARTCGKGKLRPVLKPSCAWGGGDGPYKRKREAGRGSRTVAAGGILPDMARWEGGKMRP